ncbi:MAG: Asp-tRNA(Asn)/Glu-tRNA(Gln) amidotransferase subunit GatB [Solitalea-like symbiont of Tyrophagus putrescentiae]
MSESDIDNNQYELVIGIELHAQLVTNSKIYSCEANTFGEAPNTLISPVTLAYPGTLPVLNKKVVSKALTLCLATNCQITKTNHFDRKNYFYADLPKGYQITQYFTPMGTSGYVEYYLGDETIKKVRINRIHIEEDTGKSMHDQLPTESLIDFNRAGVPLVEIVSEPDMSSAEEAGKYVAEMRKILRYLNVSEANMEEGNLRCDVNVSVRKKGSLALGNRTEIKNLNSISNLQTAINYEFKRQVQSLIDGRVIDKNTLGFDVITGQTFVLRTKEDSNDYRYFPEPDISPFVLSDEYIESVKNELPELPGQLVDYFCKVCKLSLREALIITEDKETVDYYIKLIKYTNNFKAAYNWLMGPIKSYLNKEAIAINDFLLPPEKIAELINFVDTGKVNYSIAASTLFGALIHNPAGNVQITANELKLIIDTDADTINTYIEDVLSKYPDKIKEYHNGKKNLIGLFMGEIMHLTKGRINPKEVSNILIERLNSYK